MKMYLLTLLLSLPIVAIGQSGETNKVETAVSPKASSVVVVLKDKSWTVEELNELALAFAQKNTDMPKGLRFETVVTIYPADKVTMCKFLYFQGFGRPFWTVKIGYDGKILKSEKSVALEMPPNGL